MSRKLLQINPVVRTNTSTGKIMRELGELAMESGWESYVAYSRGRDGIPRHSSKLVPVGNRADLFFHWLLTRLFDAHGLASRRATKKLIGQIKEIDPDIIHIHNVHGYFLNYPLLCGFLAERGRPVIWTAHDCWLFTGHCYYYSAVECMRWKTGCHDCPQKKSFPASWLFDRSRRNWKDKRDSFAGLSSLHLVAVSEWMKRQIDDSFLKGLPCRVIHNGIDLDTFKPGHGDVRQRYGIRHECFALAVASIWLPEKGFDDLLRFSEKLRDDEQLVVIGRLSEAQLKQFSEKITAIPRTENARTLAELYSAATAFINPTWQDNYPTVNLEAIACGTPVITYRTGGSVEAVTEGTGFVVGQGDTDAMAERFHFIREKGANYYRESCAAFASANFAKEARFRDYIEDYENLAAR